MVIVFYQNQKYADFKTCQRLLVIKKSLELKQHKKFLRSILKLMKFTCVFKKKELQFFFIQK